MGPNAQTLQKGPSRHTRELQRHTQRKHAHIAQGPNRHPREPPRRPSGPRAHIATSPTATLGNYEGAPKRKTRAHSHSHVTDDTRRRASCGLQKPHPRAYRGSTFSFFQNKNRVDGWDRKEKVIVLQHGPNAQTLQRLKPPHSGTTKASPAETRAHCTRPKAPPSGAAKAPQRTQAHVATSPTATLRNYEGAPAESAHAFTFTYD